MGLYKDVAHVQEETNWLHRWNAGFADVVVPQIPHLFLTTWFVDNIVPQIPPFWNAGLADNGVSQIPHFFCDSRICGQCCTTNAAFWPRDLRIMLCHKSCVSFVTAAFAYYVVPEIPRFFNRGICGQCCATNPALTDVPHHVRWCASSIHLIQ